MWVAGITGLGWIVKSVTACHARTRYPADMAAQYTDDIKLQAKMAWLSGEPVQSIVQRLAINDRRVIYRWRDSDGWDNQRPPETALLATTRRYNSLIELDDKKDSDWTEIHKLTDLILRFEKMEAVRAGESVGAGRTPGVKNGEGKPKKRKKNEVDHLTAADFQIVYETVLYPHQRMWLEAGENELSRRIRFILKSRQIGATFAFAFEAFREAVLRKHNQIFISSTKAQAEVFKSYISIVAREHFNIEISGNPVKLSNGAELHFLSPNSYADSRSGDVYFDECFKTRNFKRMEEIAAPMATLKEYRKTYFSSPTAISHPAHHIWCGERYTDHHPGVEINVTNHTALKTGRMDVDGIWRCVTSVHTAIAMGWDRVDLDQLRLETPDPNTFASVYECKFVDDSDSVFKLSELLECGVDTTQWADYHPDSDYPFGSKAVSIGYDPAGEGDNASAVVLSKPESVDDKFRLLEKHVWKKLKTTEQALRLERITQRYNVEHFEVDATGPGALVMDFVETFYPRIIRTVYTADYKSRMVQKAQSVIQNKRLEYDENDLTLPLAFLTVHMTTTGSGMITYESSRNAKVGHGDEAWATMQAMMCEPLSLNRRQSLTAVIH